MKSIKKLRFIIAYLSCMLTVVSMCLVFLISCQTSQNQAPYVYTIQSGDTLWTIAKNSGLTIKEIVDYNNLKNSHISSGQIILLPGIKQLPKSAEFQNLPIIHRNQWGAAKAGKMNSADSFDKITIHHTAERKDTIKRNDIHHLKIIQNYHQKERKWADIGYHFIIGKDGSIYEGRLLQYQGAHVRNHNKGNIGIALLGDLNIDVLNSSQQSALTRLINALRDRYDISAENIYGHKDLGATNCPGHHTTEFLMKLKNLN